MPEDTLVPAFEHPTELPLLALALEPSTLYGNQALAYAELEILDDLNPPTVNLLKPQTATSIFPGKNLSVAAAANDDKYVNEIEFILLDESGAEFPLEVKYKDRKEDVETIRVPNPGTLGSIIVSERFNLSRTASIVFPEDLIFTHAGQTFDLFARATDNGINTTDSTTVPVLILEDTTPPTINLKAPLDILYDRQETSINFSVSDNIQLESVRVTIEDDYLTEEEKVLVDVVGINSKSYSDIISSLVNEVVNLDRYAEALRTEAEVSFSVIIEAVDFFGNEARYVRRVTVLPDNAPRLSVASSEPAFDIVKGGYKQDRFTVDDDYELWSRSLLVFSSLSEMENRHITGTAIVPENWNEPGLPKTLPRISINYPEANDWQGQFMLGDSLHLVVANNAIDVFVDESSQYFRSANRFSIVVDGEPISANYRLTVFHDNVCAAAPEVIELNDVTMVNIASYTGSDVTRIDVEIDYPNPDISPTILTWFYPTLQRSTQRRRHYLAY